MLIVGYCSRLAYFAAIVLLLGKYCFLCLLELTTAMLLRLTIYVIRKVWFCFMLFKIFLFIYCIDYHIVIK